MIITVLVLSHVLFAGLFITFLQAGRREEEGLLSGFTGPALLSHTFGFVFNLFWGILPHLLRSAGIETGPLADSPDMVVIAGSLWLVGFICNYKEGLIKEKRRETRPDHRLHIVR